MHVRIYMPSASLAPQFEFHSWISLIKGIQLAFLLYVYSLTINIVDRCNLSLFYIMN